MHENALRKKIVRSAIVKLLLSLPVLLAGMGMVLLLSFSGLLSPIGFPEPFDVGSSMQQIDDAANKPIGLGVSCITLKSATNDTVDTGIYKEKGGVANGHYLAAFVEDRYVLCLVNNRQYDSILAGGDCKFTGVLVSLDDDVLAMVYSDMEEQGIKLSDAKSLVYPYFIDGTENGVAPRAMLYGLTLTLLALGLVLAARNLAVALDFRRYGPVKKLAPYGEPADVLDEIEREYAAEQIDWIYPLVKRRSSICLTANWIVSQGPLHVKFCRATDLMWAYKQKQTTKYYGVITMGVAYFIRLLGRRGTIAMVGDEFTINNVLVAIRQRYPWVVVGYSVQLDAMWRAGKAQFEAYASSMQSGQDDGPRPDRLAGLGGNS